MNNATSDPHGRGVYQTHRQRLCAALERIDRQIEALRETRAIVRNELNEIERVFSRPKHDPKWREMVMAIIEEGKSNG